MRNFRNHLITSKSTIKEALVKLDVLAKDAILFVVDANDTLVGSLTDGDVRRGLLKGVTINELVDSIIQSKPRYIKKGERDIEKVIEYREGNYRTYSFDELKMKKHNDYYVVILGFGANSKGGTSRVELAITPNNNKLFQIRHRNKSIKGLKIVGREKLKNLKKDLKVLLKDKEDCLKLVNALASTASINKFNL